MKIESFPPIIDPNCEILILGTMPGDESLKIGEYYANTKNQFWKVLSLLTGKDFDTSYENKTKLLLECKIAIWDVLKYCVREGSKDSHIHGEYSNDFASFF